MFEYIHGELVPLLTDDVIASIEPGHFRFYWNATLGLFSEIYTLSISLDGQQTRGKHQYFNSGRLSSIKSVWEKGKRKGVWNWILNEILFIRFPFDYTILDSDYLWISNPLWYVRVFCRWHLLTNTKLEFRRLKGARSGFSEIEFISMI